MIDIGRIGIWQGVLDRHPAGRVREVVAELDEAGWPTLWIPETVSRDPFVSAAMMLEATDEPQGRHRYRIDLGPRRHDHDPMPR